jgi:carbamoyltransferase
MLILGLNNGIDAGAALVEDGRVVCAINEERLNRQKMFWGPPLLSLEEVLRVADVDPADVDHVAQSSITGGGGVHNDFLDPPGIKKLVEEVSRFPFSHSDLVKSAYRMVSGRQRKDEVVDARLRQLGISAPKRYIEHHQCHAASAYYCSPFGDTPEDVLVMTADGVGDGICHSTNVVDKSHHIVRKHESMIFHSVAEIYAYVTHNLGFMYNRHEGKVTGLAAYGKPEKTIGIFRQAMGFDPDRLELRSGLHAWGRPGAKKLHAMLQGYKREDIAAGLQRALEEVMCGLVGASMRRYEKRLLCVAGGLFCNVRMNQALLELPEVEDIYIHPGMGDCGQGLGAALGLWAELEESPKPQLLRNVYLGPSYGDDEIERALASHGVEYHRPENVHRETARLLADKKVVARFAGRMEYGPRALGHRTIYYQTADRTVNDWLNKRLERTEFMPFAPILLKERAHEFLAGWEPEHSVAANFMTITYGVTKKAEQVAPAAVHVDATARPQTVTAEDNPEPYALIKAYEQLTGVPILVNTSFNMHEEPIVCTPHDAIRAFLQGRLDALAIGDFIALGRDGS